MVRKESIKIHKLIRPFSLSSLTFLRHTTHTSPPKHNSYIHSLFSFNCISKLKMKKTTMPASHHHHQKPHAIMIPYPYQGHINPFVYLAMKLASQGFTITFVNTQSVHSRISRAQSGTHGDDIFAAARDSGLDIRYATVSDGFPLGFDRSLNHDQFVEGLIHVFSAHVDELVASLARSDPPVTCLIADTFYVWSSAISRKHNLVSVSFWTEPALVLSLYYHLDLLNKNGHFGSKGK